MLLTETDFANFTLSAMHTIIIFASGQGSNARAIIEHFKKTGAARVALIVCNKPQASVLDIAREEDIPTLLVDKASFNEPAFLQALQSHNPDMLVLAGFLWKVPDAVIAAFPQRIVNIHPALLPAYGGKGMYGQHVHEAVLAAGERESGITIHYVNEVYDSGAIILQARCPINKTDTATAIANRIHLLEHFYYPITVSFLLQQKHTDHG